MEIILKDNDCTKNGKFDLDAALLKAGRKAGICYSETDFDKLDNESEKRVIGRATRNITKGHHSVAGHVTLDLEIIGIPKILAMLMNNEHDYNTSERSFRYTRIKEGMSVTALEVELYEKWRNKLNVLIYKYYENFYSSEKLEKMINKIDTLAKENARYMVNIMVPTSMAYKTSWRQFNYMIHYMQMEINNPSNEIFEALVPYMKEFVLFAEKENIILDSLLDDKKGRHFTLFDNSINGEYFEVSPRDGRVYNTNYMASYACLAQSHRHRSLNFSANVEISNSLENRVFIPPIIMDDLALVTEWIDDMCLVYSQGVHPQGEMILINENGTIDNFLNSKSKERLCTAAQLEIYEVNRLQFELYREALRNQNSPLLSKFEDRDYPIRCMFKDYECQDRCNLPLTLRLERRI